MRRGPLLLLLAIGGGCHQDPNPTMTMPVDGALPPGDGSEAAGDMLTPRASELDFTFDLSDAKIPLHAHVSIDAAGQVGRITILDDYPASVRVTPHVSLTVVGFTDLFKPGYCDSVRQNAQVAATSADASVAAAAKRLVRQSGAVTVRVPVSPLLGAGFLTAATDGARAAGAVANRFELTNPLIVDAATLGVGIEQPGAVSDIIGSTEEFAGPLVQGFNSKASFWIERAEYGGATGAKDFLCDLVSGKANVQVNLTGTVGGQAWKGYSWTGPLVAE